LALEFARTSNVGFAQTRDIRARVTFVASSAKPDLRFKRAAVEPMSASGKSPQVL
jgi:hypothetical protein